MRRLQTHMADVCANLTPIPDLVGMEIGEVGVDHLEPNLAGRKGKAFGGEHAKRGAASNVKTRIEQRSAGNRLTSHRDHFRDVWVVPRLSNGEFCEDTPIFPIHGVDVKIGDASVPRRKRQQEVPTCSVGLHNGIKSHRRCGTSKKVGHCLRRAGKREGAFGPVWPRDASGEQFFGTNRRDVPPFGPERSCLSRPE